MQSFTTDNECIQASRLCVWCLIYCFICPSLIDLFSFCFRNAFQVKLQREEIEFTSLLCNQSSFSLSKRKQNLWEPKMCNLQFASLSLFCIFFMFVELYRWQVNKIRVKRQFGRFWFTPFSFIILIIILTRHSLQKQKKLLHYDKGVCFYSNLANLLCVWHARGPFCYKNTQQKKLFVI